MESSLKLIRGYIKHVTRDRISLLGELWKLFSFFFFFCLTHAHLHNSTQTDSLININRCLTASDSMETLRFMRYTKKKRQNSLTGYENISSFMKTNLLPIIPHVINHLYHSVTSPQLTETFRKHILVFHSSSYIFSTDV